MLLLRSGPGQGRWSQRPRRAPGQVGGQGLSAPEVPRAQGYVVGVTAHFPSRARHPERHRADRGAWLRAGVLGADDGLVSTASLMLGVAASHASRSAILTAGFAGLAAGAMAMAAGEYVSVSSQRDTERSDLARESQELVTDPDAELEELTRIYRRRGLDADLARQVAVQLTAHDALGTHAREELGLSEEGLSQPVMAAATSAGAFSLGALVPIVAMLLAPTGVRSIVIVVVVLAALAVLGAVGAIAGGAPWRRAALRVVIGGSAAMAITSLVGLISHTAAG